jgi:drug/metabolite transporter (DMT)-like permease
MILRRLSSALSQGSGMQTPTRGYVIAFSSAVLLAFTGIFIRYLTETYDLPPLALAFWRNVFVVVTLACVVAIVAGRRSLFVKRSDVLHLTLYGLVLAVFNALWTSSVALVGATVATVLVYSSGGFTVLLGWAFLGERLDRPKLAAVALALAGCGMVCGAFDSAIWRADPAGLVAGVLSGLLYAIYTVMGSSAARRGLSPWTTVLYAFGFAALFLLAFHLTPYSRPLGVNVGSSDLLWLGDAWAGWAVLFALAAGPTAAGFGLYNMSLGYLPSGIVNLIVTLEPPLTALIAYALLGERLTGTQLTGGALIVSAVGLLRITATWTPSIRLRTGWLRPSPSPPSAPSGGGEPPEGDKTGDHQGGVDQQPVVPGYQPGAVDA